MRSRPSRASRGIAPRAERLPDPPARLWRSAEPERSYDVVIVGAGGHGLATAYYLAAEHGIRDVAVLERGWLAGGNMARNTTIIRSNYLLDESAALYGHALDLWERWPAELDYDFLLSQRGVLNLVHTEQEVRDARRRAFANGLNGIDAEFVGPDEVAALCPILDVSPDRRYRVLGATWQARAGIAKHDHVAWALATRASELGVDLIERCEVTGFVTDGERVTGVRTSRGDIAAGRVGLAAAGRTSELTDTLGWRIPLQSHPLQALVSELLEPVHPCVVMSNHVHVYCSQAHKGELVLGAGIDSYNGYGQRGSVQVIERQLAAALELFPIFARAHVIRTWAGVVDVTPDASPIIGPTPFEGLYVNCGWGTGGFKATPAAGRVFAHTVATGSPHPLNEPYGWERFRTGALIDEHGAAAVAH
ncbi:sarcosine oxidase subunit beta family protein [Saccharopolyspora sp. NFXS83]|uniref:sarcosine oxidase subunit beta family protein n=1 Tax=Saccharopolyspora sp. NFXS83 TaxID=2993560 RepID=UPI00224AA129|nr:sarcosine oxidase subunit beta family protein [Saccharopolyspora sp. NFXS83]MCX2729881.1 sarcosine oxidase subunit beta family protein [Saccharopolyspora sp. NFXS83]